MTARAIGVALAAVAVVAVGTRCGDSSGPTAGVLQVQLSTPNPGADGAIILTVTGPAPLTSVTSPLAGGRAFTDSLGTTTRIIVTGPLVNGTIAAVGVANVGQVGSYRASIQQIAAADYTLRPLGGYTLSLVR